MKKVFINNILPFCLFLASNEMLFCQNTNSIEGVTWEDTNANGIQDAGEPPLDSLFINLIVQTADSSHIFKSTISDNNGNYIFSEIPNGTYFVHFIKPKDFELTYQDNGSSDFIDSDVDVLNQLSKQIQLSSNDNKIIDAGLYKQGCFGNFVWHDLNGNGIQDNGEPGIENVKFILKSVTPGGDTIFFTTVSDSLGFYRFNNLIPGSYFCQMILTNGYSITNMSQGPSDITDSNFLPTGFSLPNNISSGECDLLTDLGLISSNPCNDGAMTYDERGIDCGGVFCPPCITNISNETVNITVSIFPNPGYETLNVFPFDDNYKISISNLFGRNISNCNNCNRMDISQLTAGTYIVSVKSNKISKPLKWIKN